MHDTGTHTKRQPRWLQRNTQTDRATTQETTDTADDKELSVQEVKNVVASLGRKKAPGEDGIPSEVYKRLVEIYPAT